MESKYQSFDWRTLVEMKKINKKVPTSALIDASTVTEVNPATNLSYWFAGLDLNSFPGASLGAKIAQAAKSIGSSTLSPNWGAKVQELFTNKEMVDEAHKLGLTVVPWTVRHAYFDGSYCFLTLADTGERLNSRRGPCRIGRGWYHLRLSRPHAALGGSEGVQG